MLAITARFVGDYYGVEWPASPSRLYSALVATMYATQAEAAKPILQRLEATAPPQIAYPPAEPTLYSTFQPGAGRLMLKKNPGPQDLAKATIEPNSYGRPTLLYPTEATIERWALKEKTITYIWPSLTFDSHELRLLSSIVEAVPYLGRSESLAMLWIDDQPPAPTIEPGIGKNRFDVAVAYEGRLHDLDVAMTFEASAAPRRYVPYRWCDEPALSTGLYSDMIVLEQSGGYRPYGHQAEEMCDAMRRAYLAIGGDDLPPLLSGHGGGPHLAWTALLNVGYAYSDGRILGYGATLPRAASVETLALHRSILSQLKTVYGPRGREMSFQLAPAAQAAALKPDRWARESRIWQTATPVVWDRYPKPGRATEFAGVMCERAGFPQPIKVIHGSNPGLAGAFPAPQHLARRYRGRYISHCYMEFDEPIAGPVLLGRGHHFGLGFFAPVEDQAC